MRRRKEVPGPDLSHRGSSGPSRGPLCGIRFPPLESRGDIPFLHRVGTEFRELPVYLTVVMTITSNPTKGSRGAGPPLETAVWQFICIKRPPSLM